MVEGVVIWGFVVDTVTQLQGIPTENKISHVSEKTIGNQRYTNQLLYRRHGNPSGYKTVLFALLRICWDTTLTFESKLFRSGNVPSTINWMREVREDSRRIRGLGRYKCMRFPLRGGSRQYGTQK